MTSADVTKIAGYVSVSSQMVVPSYLTGHSLTSSMDATIRRAIDRMLNPWNYPDTRGWPAEFVPFPRLRQVHDRLKHLVRYRVRLVPLDNEPEWDE